jgi:CheY-like chemotaxis protein
MANSLAPQNDQKTILLATDDTDVLALMTKSLLQNNYEVIAESSGEDAMKAMKKHKGEIHLLLSALDMPGVNGLGLAAQVSMKWPDLKRWRSDAMRRFSELRRSEDETCGTRYLPVADTSLRRCVRIPGVSPRYEGSRAWICRGAAILPLPSREMRVNGRC